MLAESFLLGGQALAFFPQKNQSRFGVIELVQIALPIGRSTDHLTVMLVQPFSQRREACAYKLLSKDATHGGAATPEALSV